MPHLRSDVGQSSTMLVRGLKVHLRIPKKQINALACSGPFVGCSNTALPCGHIQQQLTPVYIHYGSIIPRKRLSEYSEWQQSHVASHRVALIPASLFSRSRPFPCRGPPNQKVRKKLKIFCVEILPHTLPAHRPPLAFTLLLPGIGGDAKDNDSWRVRS